MEEERRRVEDAFAATPTSSIVEATNTEWTNEKHSLYLNSIEETFVNQLHNHDYHLSAAQSFLSRMPKHIRASGSSPNSISSDQFKVHRRGRWEQLQFVQVQSENENESHTLSANPWIKHFRSSDIRGSHHTECERDEKNSYGDSASSKQLPSSSKNVYHQESVGSTTEVSDQNFPDNDLGGTRKWGRTCRKRKQKNVANGVSGRDQIVPCSSTLIFEGNHT